jgi:hypothetical protein
MKRIRMGRRNGALSLMILASLIAPSPSGYNFAVDHEVEGFKLRVFSPHRRTAPELSSAVSTEQSSATRPSRRAGNHINRKSKRN